MDTALSQQLAAGGSGGGDRKKEPRTSTNGIPTPKYVISSQIRSVNTRSVIDMVYEKRKDDEKQKDGETETSGIACSALSSDLTQKISDHNVKKQEMWTQAIKIKQQDENFTDGRNLTEDDFEQADVVILQNREEAYDAEDDMKQQNHQEHFNRYTHHHFLSKWGRMGPKTDKNEEWWIEEPQVVTEDEAESLCEMCCHIDFEVLLTRKGLPGNSKPGPTVIELHGLEMMVKRKDCPFCRLITRKIVADGIVDLNDEEALEYTDLNLAVLEEEDEGSMLRLEVTLTHPTEMWPPQVYIIQTFYGSCPKNGTFQTLYVDPKRAGGNWLKSHLKACQDGHSQGGSLGHDMKQLRVIDVKENRVVEVELPCSYVCLSYVWGGVTQKMNTSPIRDLLMREDGLLNEAIGLPKTITDAMEVTKMLDLRYLWVDALCIMQDDDEDRKLYIGNMSSIYSCAQLTIVAPNNLTPHDGFPGVTDVPRTRQQIREVVQGIPMAVAFQDVRMPLADVELSNWNTRAWTYQERHLSQRLAFFTESQVIFACQHSTYFEDTTLSVSEGAKFKPVPRGLEAQTQLNLQAAILQDGTQIKHVNKAFVMDIGIQTFCCQHDLDTSNGFPQIEAPLYKIDPVKNEDSSGFLSLRFENLWNVYAKAVASYTSRKLTNAEDIIPAFQGLCNWIRQGAEVEFHYNLPGYAFDQALLWYPSEELKRRRCDGKPLNPTWAWSGWQGPVRYRGRRWRNALYRGQISAARWRRRIEPQDFFEKHGAKFAESQKISLEEAKEEIMSKDMKLLQGVEYNDLNFFDYKANGWRCVMDKKRNQHAFVQEEKYALPTGGPIVFPYPISLPGQEKLSLPDGTGTLYFMAFSAQARFIDMENTKHVDELGIDHFLQIGLNDEKRSQGIRPPWKRIIYHQGYRAGFLVLNIPFEEIDVEDQERYSLVALSRDELPDIGPPPQGGDAYHALNPVELHKIIGWKAYGQRSEGDVVDASGGVNVGVEPGQYVQREDDDAHWDRGRFEDCIYPLYNLLLIDQKDKGPATRVGVGRIHMLALHCAAAKFTNISLM